MNSSSLSKALAGTAAIALTGIGACLWLALAGNLAAAALSGVMAVLSFLVLHAVARARRAVAHAAAVCRSIGTGDFERRTDETLDQGEVLQLLTNINFLADHTDAFIREAVASTQAIANNKYYRRILMAGMEGSFASNARLINRAIEQIQYRITAFSDNLSSFETFIGEMVRDMSMAGNDLSETARMMETSAASTSERATIVASASVETSSNVSTVSAAVAQLSASSDEIGNHVGRTAEVAAQAGAQARLGQKKIDGLSDAAQRIGQVVELINDIASQTNLLALNATIEAARAGEAGRGFAVVANEVKALSSQTARAIDDISGQIQQIQAATRDAVTAFNSVSETVGEIEEIAAIVAHAAREQSSATNEIARNVEQALIGTQEVSANITEVSSSADKTGAAAETVLTSAQNMNDSSATLTARVREFILELRKGPLDRRERVDADYHGPERRHDEPETKARAATPARARSRAA
jgi:methyl-accepting chemotaxis protein